ncbi:hypothetical protein ABEB36_006451 [Hypothenemus hampei]|uniref:Uncharacterized protein n=1 Tax=Hypothenemus hampei TaxID=57062 RepID=A0ABD1EQJ7_HYPHA
MDKKVIVQNIEFYTQDLPVITIEELFNACEDTDFKIENNSETSKCAPFRSMNVKKLQGSQYKNDIKRLRCRFPTNRLSLLKDRKNTPSRYDKPYHIIKQQVLKKKIKSSPTSTSMMSPSSSETTSNGVLIVNKDHTNNLLGRVMKMTNSLYGDYLEEKLKQYLGENKYLAISQNQDLIQEADTSILAKIAELKNNQSSTLSEENNGCLPEDVIESVENLTMNPFSKNFACPEESNKETMLKSTIGINMTKSLNFLEGKENKSPTNE